MEKQEVICIVTILFSEADPYPEKIERSESLAIKNLRIRIYSPDANFAKSCETEKSTRSCRVN